MKKYELLKKRIKELEIDLENNEDYYETVCCAFENENDKKNERIKELEIDLENNKDYYETVCCAFENEIDKKNERIKELESLKDKVKELSHLGYYATKIRYATSFFEDIIKIIEEESK